ncbi:hypothetical protein ACH4JS_13485 [Streptomyces sp. NPDC017638]|uniref:hypothetical protein n=1 Tax=Streptomyces sp. NPDC017638 TaxID=3365004 RepID=UPI0037B72859
MAHPGRCRRLARPRPGRDCGHFADLDAREAAAGLLPQPVLAHAALLSALTRLVPTATPGELAVAARLAAAAADPEATASLAALLTRTHSAR